MYAILEDSFELLLVNARHVKMVPGRKTDVRDCEWLAQLLECGLLKGSFIPPKPIRDLRDLTRRSVSTILRHMVFAFSEQPQLSRNRGRGDSSHDRVESSTSPESGGTHGLPGIEIVACEPFCEVVFFAGGLIQAWWGKIGG